MPILEWLASSWDPLLHEERLPLASSRFETGADLAQATPVLLYAETESEHSRNQDKQLYEKLNKAVDEIGGLVAAIKADPRKYLNVRVSIF